MKVLQPEMVRLKELHKNDKMKLQQEMMAQQDQMMQEQLMNATTDAAAKSVPGIANNVTKGMMNGRTSGN